MQIQYSMNILKISYSNASPYNLDRRNVLNLKVLILFQYLASCKTRFIQRRKHANTENIYEKYTIHVYECIDK